MAKMISMKIDDDDAAKWEDEGKKKGVGLSTYCRMCLKEFHKDKMKNEN